MRLCESIVTCIAGAVVSALPACSGNGSGSSDTGSGTHDGGSGAADSGSDTPDGGSDSCGIGHCEPWSGRPSRTFIEVAQGSASIAAIEILNPQSPDGGTSAEGCGATWSEPNPMGIGNYPVDTEPVCPAPPHDAGWVAETCATRYPCMPGRNQRDGGTTCTSAWIGVSASFGSTSTCSVTVVSTVGERQAFEVTGAWAPYSYLCHTGLGQCIEITPFSTYPSEITIRFAGPDPGTSGNDGGSAIDGQTNDGGSTIDGQTAVDAPDRVVDTADGQH